MRCRPLVVLLDPLGDVLQLHLAGLGDTSRVSWVGRPRTQKRAFCMISDWVSTGNQVILFIPLSKLSVYIIPFKNPIDLLVLRRAYTGKISFHILHTGLTY